MANIQSLASRVAALTDEEQKALLTIAGALRSLPRAAKRGRKPVIKPKVTPKPSKTPKKLTAKDLEG